ncbi:MAG TPA: hypothetical protein VEI51_00455 [Methanomicrobiales archaeon]|nr:hypothetical protein [Methanomicrobiales archaeon]
MPVPKLEIGVLAGGLVVAAALSFFDIYLAGMAVILVGTLGIAFFIMGETRDLPDLACTFSEDAKGVLVTNRGNAPAYRIHVTLVPLDREFDLPELAVDEDHAFALPSMIAEAKALVRYENQGGRIFTRTFRLSAMEKEDDLLKPLIPTFGWK